MNFLRGPPTLTQGQVAGALHYSVVYWSEQDRKGHLNFPLKRPPSEAVFQQCRRYREAGVWLVLQGKRVIHPEWTAVRDAYKLLLDDSCDKSIHPELKTAVQRLAWLWAARKAEPTVEELQEWGRSWLTDAGHGDEDNYVVHGLVNTKFDSWLSMIFTVVQNTRIKVVS